jgi:hypothetical protein
MIRQDGQRTVYNATLYTFPNYIINEKDRITAGGITYDVISVSDPDLFGWYKKIILKKSS